MGLDFRFEGMPKDFESRMGRVPSWSYSGFGAFRAELADLVGFKLKDMAGFGGKKQLSWEPIETPLKPLLNHSDCEGELIPTECAMVYPELRRLAAQLSEDNRDRALMLANCMEECVKRNTPLIFC